MMLGFALWVYETLVVRFCACTVSLTVQWWVKPEDSPNCRFEFHKCRKRETLSVVTMCVCNPDRSPASMIPLPKCRMIRHNSRRAAF